MVSEYILKCEKLVVGYQQALCPEINLTLQEGQLLFVKGDNGTGKSTLVKTLNNEIIPLKGNYQWFVHSSSISVLPQIVNTQFHFSYTMGEILDIYNVSEKHRAFLPNKFENKKWKDSSRGEKQEVLILTQLKQDTKVLILDEPFNHISQTGMESIQKLLERILRNNRKFTIVLVSHKIVSIQGFDVTTVVL